MSDTPVTQQDIEWDRRDDGRCPRCGSKHVHPDDYVQSEEGDDIPVGIACDDCGFSEDRGKVWDDAPFILPGDVGSRDTA